MNTDIVSLSTLIINMIVMLWVSISDIRHRQISNTACLIILGTSLVSSVTSGFIAESAIGCIVVFMTFFLLWYLRVLGAGDVKLISAFSLGISPDFLVLFLVITGLSGGIQIAVMYIIALFGRRSPFQRGIPYGVSISVSGVFFSCISSI